MRNRFLAVVLLAACFAPVAFADLIPDKNDKGKFGYVDENGAVVIKYNYNEAFAFVDGKAKVRKGDSWGYIDPQGKEVIKIKYSEMQTWENGVCKVAIGGKMDEGDLSGAKWGYIDASGKEVLKIEYDNIGLFDKGGLALIEKGKKLGYISTAFQEIVQCKYAAIGRFDKNGHTWVNEGGSVDAKTGLPKGGKFGIIDRKGNFVVPAEYAVVGKFLPDTAFTNYNRTEVYSGDINDTPKYVDAIVGKYMKSPSVLGSNFRNILYGSIAGTEIAQSRFPGKESSLNYSGWYANYERRSAFVGLTERMAKNFDFKKESVLPESDCEFYWASKKNDASEAEIYSFAGQLVLSTTGSKPKGGFSFAKAALSAVGTSALGNVGTNSSSASGYKFVGTPSDGMVFVAKDFGKKTKINFLNLSTGGLAFAEDLEMNLQKFDEKTPDLVTDYCKGVAEVRIGGESYLIDKSGNKISDDYSSISDFYESVAIVKKGSKYGFIGLDGKIVADLEYDNIVTPTENMIPALKDGKTGYLDLAGNVAIPFIYENNNRFRNGLAPAKTETGWGFIDKSGAKVVDFKWKDLIYPDKPDPRYVWVMNSDSLYYNLDRKSGKLISKGYKYAKSNFDDSGIAYVVDTNGKSGCVNVADQIILPFLFSDMEQAKSAYAQIKSEGKERMSDTDAYRYVIYSSDERNKFKLTDKIPSDIWDY